MRFTRDFSKNAKKSKYSILKSPLFSGNTVWISKSAFEHHRTVDFQLKKIDTDNFGILDIKFQNACFNKLGFLVHDTCTR